MEARIEDHVATGVEIAPGSWESIADEVSPPGAPAAGRRGLATGAMRGKPLPGPRSMSADPGWWGAPQDPRAILCPVPSPGEPLAEAVGGQEMHCERNGPHLLVKRPAAEYDACFAGLLSRLQNAMESECVALGCADAAEVVFVDIETTGLSSAAPLFLIGALCMDGEPTLHLFLARDYPEERAALAAYHALANGRRLVTFNGKRFDWPYIEGRTRSHRLAYSPPPSHFDLLHHARREWKHGLPNCKLQTLELYLCGRTRIDDMPGHQIPAAYHEFVATHAVTGGGAHLMAPILHHNALDILTMAELVCKAGEQG